LAYRLVTNPSGVQDSSSNKAANLTPINYMSYGSNGKCLVGSKVQRAVIITHGAIIPTIDRKMDIHRQLIAPPVLGLFWRQTGLGAGLGWAVT
jgi:hypothetical protein